MKRLRIKAIELKSSKLLSDLNMEKRIRSRRNKGIRNETRKIKNTNNSN